jgi:formyltetrahydrofolate hydrolase
MPRHQNSSSPGLPDTKGIVHAVSGLLYQAGCNIIDSQQFGDVQGDDATGLFFMRVHFEAPRTWPTRPRWRSCSAMCAQQFRHGPHASTH